MLFAGEEESVDDSDAIEDESEEDVEEEEGDQDDDEDESADEDADDKKSDKSEDSDDDKPITRKDLKTALAEALDKRGKNRSNARDRVNSKKNSDTRRDNGTRPDPKIDARLSDLELSERKRAFGHENGLSPREADYLFSLKNNNPTKKDLQDPFIQGGLEAMRRADRAKNNIPRTFGRGNSSKGGKSFAELKPEERQKNFRDFQDNILRSKGLRN